MVLWESMMMGVATNIVAARPTLTSIASNSSHCHPADRWSTLLSHVICPGLCRYGLVTKKIMSVCMQQCHAPKMIAITKFKTTKINFEGLFGLSTKLDPTKITHHTIFSRKAADGVAVALNVHAVIMIMF